MNIIDQLRRDYPTYNYQPADDAHWSYQKKTIYYTDDAVKTLHELGHALADHSHYHLDAELLTIERQAWQIAQKLAPHYSLTIDDETIESALDSYREWLHIRSKCPTCQLNGVQSAETLYYQCPNCLTIWQANTAKNNRLKRHIIKK